MLRGPPFFFFLDTCMYVENRAMCTLLVARCISHGASLRCALFSMLYMLFLSVALSVVLSLCVYRSLYS